MTPSRGLILLLLVVVAGCASRLTHVPFEPRSVADVSSAKRTSGEQVRVSDESQFTQKIGAVPANETTELLLDQIQERGRLNSGEVAQLRKDLASAPPSIRPFLGRMFAAAVATQAEQGRGAEGDEDAATAIDLKDARTVGLDGRIEAGRLARADQSRTASRIGRPVNTDLVGVSRAAPRIDEPSVPSQDRLETESSAAYKPRVAGDASSVRHAIYEQEILSHRQRAQGGEVAPVSASTRMTDIRDAVGKRPSPDQTAAKEERADEEPLIGWRDHLRKTISLLEDELASGGDDSAAMAQRQAHLRMLYLIADDRSKAVSAIKQLTPNEQEFWAHELHALALLTDYEQIPSSRHRAAAASEQLLTAAAKLSESCPLRLSNMAFCRDVSSYGVYSEVEKVAFKPGQELQLYVEVENFTVDTTSKGYETSFSGSYHIFDAMGRPVFDYSFPAASEVCRNRRRDLYIHYKVWLPKNLYPGQYTMELQIEDVKGKRFGQATKEFAVLR